MALGAASFAPVRAADPSRVPQFHTADIRWQNAYDRALRVLAGNVQPMDDSGRPVLIEGSVYQGIWMECGPHEALVYRKFRPDVARNSHLIFFALQKEDGQIPANRRRRRGRRRAPSRSCVAAGHAVWSRCASPRRSARGSSDREGSRCGRRRP